MNAFYCCLILSLADGPQTGAVLLDDGSLVEGTVQVIDDLVCVTPPTGPARVLPARQVLFRGPDRAAVYQFVTAKSDPESAAARAGLADWFLKVNDPDRALVEARAAVRLAPKVEALAQVVTKCETAVAAKRPVVRPASATVAAPPPAVPTDAALAFGTRVQPILMNQCAACHAKKDYAGSFKLDRVPEGYSNTPATAVNLAAAVGQLNPTEIASSPLLVNATTPHGGMKSALARQHPAIRNLEGWALAYERRGWSPPKEPSPVTQAVNVEPAKLPLLKAEPVVPPANPSAGASPAARPAEARGIRLNPADPFDPAGFNGKR